MYDAQNYRHTKCLSVDRFALPYCNIVHLCRLMKTSPSTSTASEGGLSAALAEFSDGESSSLTMTSTLPGDSDGASEATSSGGKTLDIAMEYCLCQLLACLCQVGEASEIHVLLQHVIPSK